MPAARGKEERRDEWWARRERWDGVELVRERLGGRGERRKSSSFRGNSNRSRVIEVEKLPRSLDLALPSQDSSRSLLQALQASAASSSTPAL